MNKRVATVVSLIVLSSVLAAPAFSAVKAGTACKKVGFTSTAGGKKYTCVKSGKKTVWDKGVLVTKPVAEPVATPSPTPSPTQTEAPAQVPVGLWQETQFKILAQFKQLKPAKIQEINFVYSPNVDKVIAKQLEEVALKDPYFVERKLYPNVDFYSGIIYRAIGIPTEMFTVMFALGRLPGWVAQWKEMVEQGEPIGRPRQIYTGHDLRDYVPIAKRG